MSCNNLAFSVEKVNANYIKIIVVINNNKFIYEKINVDVCAHFIDCYKNTGKESTLQYELLTINCNKSGIRDKITFIKKFNDPQYNFSKISSTINKEDADNFIEILSSNLKI